MIALGHEPYQGHFDVIGSGPPLLCFAGFGCSNWIFEDLALRLAEKALWILPDARGMGRSPKVQQPYSISDLAEDGLQLMNRLKIERFGVIGISMGGFIAQTLALSHPHRITGLGLFCTTGPGPDFVPLPDIEEEQLREWYTLDPVTLAKANTQATVHPNLALRAPATFAAIVEAKQRFRADLDQVLLQRGAANAFLDSPLPLGHITCPTLVLTGENDRLVPPQNTQLLAKAIPNAEAHVIPESDHLFFLERADQVAQITAGFLEKL